MSQKNVRWLYTELPELVNRGILTPQTSSQIQDHYGPLDTGGRRNLTVLFFSILGALLIGGGVLLLLAHNWDTLTRPIRVALTLAPLAVAQFLGFRVIRRRETSLAWREGVGIGLVLAVAIALALIGQTYHVPGDLGDFLYHWIWLSLPVVYLLGAACPVVLLLAAITVWSACSLDGGSSGLGFWPLTALLLPYIWGMSRSERHPAWQGLLGWALAVALSFGAGITLHEVVPHGWIPIYGALFSAFVVAGAAGATGTRVWPRPFRTVGSLGAVGFSLILTYTGLWKELHIRVWPSFHSAEDLLTMFFLAAFALGAPIAAGILHRRLDTRTLGLSGLSIATLLAWSFIWSGDPEVAGPVIFNLYLFGLGLVHLVDGVMTRSLGAANAGMAILTVLIAARFFDPSISFVIRGLAFITVGVGFLATNIHLIRIRRVVT